MPNYGRSNLDMTRRLAFLQGGGNQPRKLSTEEQVGSVLQSLLEKVFNPAMAGIEKRRAGEREEQKLRTGRAGEMSKSLISGVASGNLEPSGDVSLPDLISSYEKTGRLPSEVTPGIPPPGGIGPRLEDVPLTFSPKAEKKDYRDVERQATETEEKLSNGRVKARETYRNSEIDSAISQGRADIESGKRTIEQRRKETVLSQRQKEKEQKATVNKAVAGMDKIIKSKNTRGEFLYSKAQRAVALQAKEKMVKENKVYEIKRDAALLKPESKEWSVIPFQDGTAETGNEQNSQSELDRLYQQANDMEKKFIDGLAGSAADKLAEIQRRMGG